MDSKLIALIMFAGLAGLLGGAAVYKFNQPPPRIEIQHHHHDHLTEKEVIEAWKTVDVEYLRAHSYLRSRYPRLDVATILRTKGRPGIQPDGSMILSDGKTMSPAQVACLGEWDKSNKDKWVACVKDKEINDPCFIK